MTPVEFLPEAQEEFSAAALFYNSQAPTLGQELVAEVDRIVALVSEHPGLAAMTPRNCRRVLVRRFPFSVFYQARGDIVFIVAFAHQHRKPYYWQTRLAP